VLAVSALLAGAIGSAIWLSAGGSSDHPKPMATRIAPDAGLRAALRLASPAAPFTAVVQTNPRGIAVARALDLADRIPGAGVAFAALEDFVSSATGVDLASKLTALAGNPIVFSGSLSEGVAIWQTRDATTLRSLLGAASQSGGLQDAGTYRSASIYAGPAGVTVAADGPLVIVGSTADAVHAALDRSASGGLTRTAFDRATAGVAKGALIRVAATGAGLRQLLGTIYSKATGVPWVAALSRGALAVTPGVDGLHADAVLETTPGELTPGDLPLADGAAAPVINGSEAITIGIRDPEHLAQWILDAGAASKAPLVGDYEDVEKLLGRFAKIDLESDILSTLTGSATLTTQDLRHFSLVADTTDPRGVADTIHKVAGIATIGSFFGADLGGFSVDSGDDGLVTIARDGEPLVTLGVKGDKFVASTDPNADFDALASGEPRGDSPDRGALRALISPRVIGDLVIGRLHLPGIARLALEPLGQTVVTARATDTTITLSAFLPIRD